MYKKVNNKLSLFLIFFILLNCFFGFNIKVFANGAEASVIDGVPLKYMPIEKNYTKGVTIKPEYIIIHDTGNRGKGANAVANRNYFNTTTREASAQFIVDDKGIVQALPATSKAWHIGDGTQQTNASNGNSIGIELCVNEDGDFGTTYNYGIKLTKYLMEKYNIPASNVIRHYDATKKICPRMMIEDDPSLWTRFKEEISKPKETNKPNIEISKEEQKQEENKVEEKKSKYEIPSVFNGRLIVNDAEVKLQPSSSVETIDFIRQGTYLNILEKVGDTYCKISYNGTEGYIPIENVKLFEDYQYDKNGTVEKSFNLKRKVIQLLSFGMLN